ncbi:MAG TPA: MFS transporter [Mycobacteriales bacterium]|nr:MFS transporter [Mycobacteriales bacterium]
MERSVPTNAATDGHQAPGEPGRSGQPGHAGGRSSRAGSLLFHRDFRLLWAGDTVSQLGTMVTMLALPLLAVRTLHASPFQVGLLTTFEYLAFLVIGLPAGAWVDRMRRRTVLIVCDVARAVGLGSLPVAAVLDMLTMTQVLLVALINGVFTVFFDVSYQSYLPSLVGRNSLVEGNAKLQGTQSVSQVAGPSLGGFLVQLLTAPYALLVDSISYLWSAACVAAIRKREPRPERPADAHLGREIREGLAFLLGHRLLRAIATCTGLFNLFGAGFGPILIVLLARDLNLAAGTIGLLLSAGAVGGLVGALLAGRFAGWVGQGPAIWLSAALTAPFGLVAPFLHRDWTLGLFVAAEFVMYIGIVIYNVTQVSFRQALCPERLLGRMNATMRFLVYGTMPLGGLLGGALASTIGVRATLLVTVLGTMSAFLPVFFSPLRTLRELPTLDEDRSTGLGPQAVQPAGTGRDITD